MQYSYSVWNPWILWLVNRLISLIFLIVKSACWRQIFILIQRLIHLIEHFICPPSSETWVQTMFVHVHITYVLHGVGGGGGRRGGWCIYPLNFKFWNINLTSRINRVLGYIICQHSNNQCINDSWYPATTLSNDCKFYLLKTIDYRYDCTPICREVFVCRWCNETVLARVVAKKVGC